MGGLYSWYKVANTLYRHHIPVLPRIIKLSMRILFAAVIPYQAQIGKGTTFAYWGLGVIIPKRIVIGENCCICQGVNIGGHAHNPVAPVIENNVFLGSGAKVFGPITIGEGSVVGANAVVTHDIPPRCLALGIPAKVVKTDIDINDYK